MARRGVQVIVISGLRSMVAWYGMGRKRVGYEARGELLGMGYSLHTL